MRSDAVFNETVIVPQSWFRQWPKVPITVHSSQQKREKPNKSRGRSLLSVRQILFRLRLEDYAGPRVRVDAVSGNHPVL